MTIYSNSSLKKKISKSTLAVFIVNGMGMLLLFISQIVLARIIGVEEYGVYAYVLSWLGVLALVGKSGLDIALQRFIPEYAGKQQWGHCRGVLLRSYQIGLLACLLLGVLVWLLSPLMLSTLQIQESVCVLLMIASLPFYVLLKITQGALLAFKRPALSQVADSVMLSLIIIAGALIVGVYESHKATSITMLGIQLIAYIISLAAGLYLLIAKTLPRQINGMTASYRTRQWITVAFPLFVMSSMYVLMNYTDIVMLGLLESTAISGIYTAVSRVAALVSLPLVFVNSVLVPYISGLYHRDRHADLQHAVTIASRTAGLLALPVFIVLVLFGDFFLGLFGAEFRTGKIAMNILVAGQLVNVFSGSVGALMMMTGRHNFASVVVTLCAVLNILLNYLLIPIMGIEGAATATVITMIIWNMSFVLSSHSDLGIKPSFFAVLKK